MKTGIELIAEERQRQKDVFGYDSANPEMAQYYEADQLQHAAVAYILDDPDNYWPCNWRHPYKPTNRLRDLVKAAAMLAHEIDRLQALEEQQPLINP